MRFYLEINCDNEAFSQFPTTEIARILKCIAEKYEAGEGGIVETIRDVNGNAVGTARLTGGIV